MPRPDRATPRLRAHDTATIAILSSAGLALVLAPFLPIAAQAMVSTPDMVSAALPLADEYGLTQLAWAHDLPRHGAAVNRASAMGQAASLWHPWWWAVGWLGRGLTAAFGSVPPGVLWALYGAASAAGALAALLLLARVVLPPGRARALAILLVIMCGGWRWLHFLPMSLGAIGKPVYADQFWGDPASAIALGTAIGGPLVDAWAAPERLLLLMTEAALLALTVLALRAGSPQRAIACWIGAGAVLALAQPVSPGFFRVAALATGLVAVGRVFGLGSAQSTGGGGARAALGWVAMFAVAWPAHHHFLSLALHEPAWEHLWTRDEPFMAHPGQIVIALGSVAAGGLAWIALRAGGAGTRLRPGAEGVLPAWGVCALLAPSIPLLTRDVRALEIAALALLPFAVLTADLVVAVIGSAFSPPVVRVIAGLALLANVPSLPYYWAAGIALAQEPRGALPAADAAVIESLRGLPAAGALTLTDSPALDRHVLAATDKRVVPGWFTALRGHAGLLRREFFDGTATSGRQAELLEALGIRFVLYDAAAVQIAQTSLRLRVIERGDRLVLLAVDPPADPPFVPQKGDVLRNPSGSIYAFDGQRRRWVPDLQTFDAYGFKWEQVHHVSGWQLAAIPEGYPLPPRSGPSGSS
jgi:hypothetical protein